MKTRITIIAAALTLQAVILFASNDITSTSIANPYTATSLMPLSPTTPAEATFDDMPNEMVSTPELAPKTPAVAEFDDEIALDNRTLLPVTPSEADFE